MQFIQLANQVRMPMLGFGVFQISAEETEQAVMNAIQAGYRHIDTAQVYFNEVEVGKGIANSGVPREELFITTKVWVNNAGETAAYASVLRSLERLNLEYLDLVLIHQAIGDVFGSWRALEKLQAEGKVRAIGVSNFTPDRLVDLGEFNAVMPQVDQIEIHPFHQRREHIEALQEEGVVVQAWAPFAEGRNDIFHNPILTAIGKKYGKSVAQVIIRWLLEQNVVVLSKSTKPERMAENLNVFDFGLTEEDKQAIATLDLGVTLFSSNTPVGRVRFLKNYTQDA